MKKIRLKEIKRKGIIMQITLSAFDLRLFNTSEIVMERLGTKRWKKKF